jgi:hypothetical protein
MKKSEQAREQLKREKAADQDFNARLAFAQSAVEAGERLKRTRKSPQ